MLEYKSVNPLIRFKFSFEVEESVSKRVWVGGEWDPDVFFLPLSFSPLPQLEERQKEVEGEEEEGIGVGVRRRRLKRPESCRRDPMSFLFTHSSQTYPR